MNGSQRNERVSQHWPDPTDAPRSPACKRHLIAAALGLSLAFSPAVPAVASDEGHVRPMGGQCTTTFAFTGPEVVQVDGNCHLLHLGLTKVSSTQSAIPQPDGTLFITTSMVYTSASGDLLHANFVGVGVPNATGVTFSGTETYRRGTGRFADAIGSSAIEGSALFTSPTGGVGEFRTLGFIFY
jgi:hypothetical protein